MNILRIFHSAEHIYVGHFGRAPGETPMVEVARAKLVAGRGIEGDRYFKRAGAKGQVTFFAEEAWLRLRRELGADRTPDVFRRNFIVRNSDLNALIGMDFEVQGLGFHGVEYCKPCFWMEHAFAPGAFERLTGWKAGGLRASVLSDGWIEAEAPENARCSA